MRLLSNNSRYQKLLTLLLVLLLPSCSEDWAKRLEYGVAIPDARISILLQEPSSKYKLFERFQKAARLGGFPRLHGDPVSEQTPNSLIAVSGFSFAQHPGLEDAGYYEYSITFSWTYGAEMPSEALFIFHNATTDGFKEREWLIFFQWYEQYLPAVFPDATLVVTRHPADATDTEELMIVSKSTGIQLPEADRIRYEKSLSAKN